MAIARNDVAAHPLSQALSHRDQDRGSPLFDALRHGFTGIEVDVWPTESGLFLGHDGPDPGRTLQAVYLDPLRRLIEENGGTVYRRFAGDLQLYLDVKHAMPGSHASIHRVLEQYGDILTQWGEDFRRKAVTAVISGNRSVAEIESRSLGYAGYDGRLADLYAEHESRYMSHVSDDWASHFTWRGSRAISRRESEKLRVVVAAARRRSCRLRFWGLVDTPGPARRRMWRTLVASGVDCIGSDDLGGLGAALRDDMIAT